MKKGIFISYRRDPASDLARLIHDKLTQRGYDCFLDVVDLNVGDYWERIMTVMDGCDIFIPILTRGALDRCADPEDSVRREIEAALERRLMIIPVTVDFDWSEKMPAGLERLSDYNAVPYNHTYFEPFIDNLCSFIESARGNKPPEQTVPVRRLPVIAGIAALVLLAALGIGLWSKGRAAAPAESIPQEPAPAAAAASGHTSAAGTEDSTGPAEGQFLPDDFLTKIEELAEKRMAGLLVENPVIEFTDADGTTWDLNSRNIETEGMELQKDALFAETGGTSALYLYYQGTLRIDGNQGGEYTDAVVTFSLDSFPQKFFSVNGDGSINYKDSDLGLYRAFVSRDEYLRAIHEGYTYVDHDIYEITLP